MLANTWGLLWDCTWVLAAPCRFGALSRSCPVARALALRALPSRVVPVPLFVFCPVCARLGACDQSRAVDGQWCFADRFAARGSR